MSNKAEQRFHMAVAQYLDLALPSHAVWTTFPAGGGGLTRGKFLKAMGLRAGWPDIQILVRSTAFDSARSFSRFIGLELKTSKGVVTATQTAAHLSIRQSGGEVYIVRTLDEVCDALANKEHLKLLAVPATAPRGRAARKAPSNISRIAS